MSRVLQAQLAAISSFLEDQTMRTKRLTRHTRRGSTGLSAEQLEDRCLLAAYTVTDLGTLGGGGTAQAFDINEAGQVVGYAHTASLQQHAFLWTDGVMTDLGSLPTGSSSKAFGLNNNGQVVGYAFDGSAAGGATNHAFLWEEGVMTDLFPVPQFSIGNAVNDAGQVVGNYNLNRPFIWEDGVFTDLGGFDGGASFGYALDINNAGQVVGSSHVNNGSEGIEQHAFLWEEGVMTDLGALPGMLDSRAHAINQLGDVVGFSSLFDPDTTDEISRSFLYSNGQMIDLNVPGDYTAAEDINDLGHIVGWMGSRAYIYEDGVVPELNTLILPGSGITVQKATGINNAGQIVGYGRAGTSTRAVLLTPTEEGTSTISIGDVTVDEGNAGVTDAIFTVSLSAPASAPVTVNFATGGGTATAGSDYTANSGMLTFESGQVSKTVTVPIHGDVIPESNETFQVTLSQATGAVIADGQGIGTIVDDEPRISINDVARKEGRSGTTVFTFTVTLSAATSAPVTVNFATANGSAAAGSDYQSQSGTLAFAAGQTTATISIVVNGDRKRESDETFFVNLSSAQGASILDGQGKGTIQDDDGFRWW
jgi:probable HAF family extracellular repeat protein